ncbi:hypothetical protein [Halalkalicoccus jeotgali]|uniref:DUF354 domain-containing protein n=1 Tax=Halalkalicoccus jeotgali (strain DSM 18796 / CECT 7217 / JCM 14584 / KCTC 4019 / B3) TaxID=795797 RepID=D8J468_HALJB|nr:hypothetical protein [Halalkalicoccus jeotgali]ADJ15460.1 hypothetical protein HacjB3_10385 [Halalkalicoccus jeotgali B3]ELY36131.1 hypothetical protein C497_12282 [Halalkalicoccus jeotgali B3]
MKYVFFTNTPAHVHLYKHAVERLAQAGHRVRVLARDYGCTVDLLEYYGLPYRVYGSCGTTKYSLVRRLPGHYARIVPFVRRFDPDLIFGMGAYAAHSGAISRTPTVLLLDSEPTSLDHLISRPFAQAILTPDAFRKDLGENHYRFAGYKECAYLHPDVFRPDPTVREELGVGGDEPYAILRFNAFGSHHDVSHSGFTPRERYRLIDRLARHARVFVSDEGGRLDLERTEGEPFDAHPALLHDALAEARLLVADSQTIVTEAGLLGTPAIRSNSFVGENDMGNFVELERAGLIENVAEFGAVLERAEELLSDPAARERLAERRRAFLETKVNLTDVIVEVAENDGDPERVGQVSRASPVPEAARHPAND